LALVDLICVGDVMLDVRVEARALAHGGDVHGSVSVQAGGTSANAAVWAAWDGASARVHGRVGADLPGRLLEDALRERHVEPALTMDPESPTGTMLVVHEAGERSMVADRGANARLAPSDLPSALRAGSVLVSGYLLLHPDTHAVAVAALERADARFVAVEAASWPLLEEFGVGRFVATTRRANAVLANETEAEVLTGSSGEEAARLLGEHYGLACVKMGALGAVLALNGEIHRIAAEHVDEVDPTGSGDAFDGVLLGALSRGVEPAEAMLRAGHAGALVAAGAQTWPEEVPA
jgi:sugar/nucleoside kinase (ribokinase family)